MKKMLRLIGLCTSFLMVVFLATAQPVKLATGSPTSVSSTGDGVTFVVQNTNAYTVVLTGLDSYWGSNTEQGALFNLWYSSTSLSGGGTVASPDWTLVAETKKPIVTLATNQYSIRNIFNNLAVPIPANTTYRFFLRCDIRLQYAESFESAGNSTTSEGVALRIGSYMINGETVGASATGNELLETYKFFYGSISFIKPGCTPSLAAGKVVQNPARPLCSGESSELTLENYTQNTDITYQWESAATANGPFVAFGAALPYSPQTTVAPAATTYYRCAAVCGGSTVYSDTIMVWVNNSSLPAGTYTINQALPLSPTNLTSFNMAVNAMRCGVTGPVVFEVASGGAPYIERVSIPAIPGASEVNTITFKGNGNTLKYVIEDGASRYVLQLDSARYVTVENLTIDASGGNGGWGIHFKRQANHNTVTKCNIITDTSNILEGFTGIAFCASESYYVSPGNNGSYNTIVDCDVLGGYEGIFEYGQPDIASANAAAYNIFTNNNIHDFYYAGINLNNSYANQVVGNQISRPNRINGGVSIGIGVGTSINTMVAKNKIYNLTGGLSTNITAYGLQFFASVNDTAVNNLVYHFTGTGTRYGIWNYAGTGLALQHNTISIDSLDANTGSSFGFNQSSAGTGIDFRNNIVSVTRPGAGYAFALSSSAAVNSNYNTVYVGGANKNMGRLGFTAVPTWADWQAANGGVYDANSKNENPLFADTANANFAPTSAAIDNSGTPLWVKDDLLGVERSNTPDPGAYEFTGVLPLHLLDIAAQRQAQNALVTWAATQETNLSHFIVERSVDGLSYSYAGRVEAMGGNTLNSYRFVDANAAGVATSTVLYYRLKAVDKDGAVSFSNIATMRLEKLTGLSMNIFPNPVRNEGYLKIVTGGAGKAQVKIMDLQGRLLTTHSVALQNGSNIISLNDAKLRPGMYQVVVEYGGNITSLKLVKQ